MAADKKPGFAQELSSLLDDATRKRLAVLLWRDRFTSLWAPVTIFGLAFAIYLVPAELSACSYLWLLPLLRGFGLLMLAAFFGLAIARLTWKGFNEPRSQRHQARELLSELGRVVDRHADKLEPKSRQALLQGAASMGLVMAQGDWAQLPKEREKLDGLVDKHLAAWRKGSSFDFAGGFVKALAIALAIRTVLIEPFKIPSGSMVPTLEIGDQIFVNKFIYGVRIPWVNVVPFVIVREPKRGDVIVFNNPVEPDRDYVKRVIGVPGDVIELRDKVLLVNGKPAPVEVLNENYLFADRDNDAGTWFLREETLERETIDGQSHLTLRHRGRPFGEEGPFEVPPRNVFVLGDNRDNSMDSRYGLGQPALGVQYVPFGNIKGKAMVVWLALGYRGLGASLFGGTGIRTERLFKPVDLCGNEAPPPASEP